MTLYLVDRGDSALAGAPARGGWAGRGGRGGAVRFRTGGTFVNEMLGARCICKKYGALHNLTENGVKKVLKKLKETGGTARKKGTGKGMSVVTEEKKEEARELYERGDRVVRPSSKRNARPDQIAMAPGSLRGRRGMEWPPFTVAFKLRRPI